MPSLEGSQSGQTQVGQKCISQTMLVPRKCPLFTAKYSAKRTTCEVRYESQNSATLLISMHHYTANKHDLSYCCLSVPWDDAGNNGEQEEPR